ncbi:MAG TPA: hypothetical protein VKH81_03845 [Candidatus Angelobacter sp.]|nr:hypothetical protein [Candidatus Angelobacter sp.]
MTDQLEAPFNLTEHRRQDLSLTPDRGRRLPRLAEHPEVISKVLRLLSELPQQFFTRLVEVH